MIIDLLLGSLIIAFVYLCKIRLEWFDEEKLRINYHIQKMDYELMTIKRNRVVARFKDYRK